MRCLVTGSAGFVGAHVARALKERGDAVLGVDDLSGGSNVVPGIELLQVNLARDALDGVTAFRPEVVFHAAANAREIGSLFQPRAVCAANVMATGSLVEAAILGGALRRFVFTSSIARYGDQTPPFDEALSPRPEDVYAANKVCCEAMLRALGHVHAFEVAILVPHNVVGTLQSLRDKFRNVAGISMNRIMRGDPVVVFGDGEQKRAFSAIEDSLPCFVRACDGAIDRLTVNVGGTRPVTVNELIAAVKESMGVGDAYPTRRLPDRPLEVKYAWPTYARSQQLLGYEERLGWRESVHRMAAWAKERGPQEWTADTLPLSAPSKPEVW